MTCASCGTENEAGRKFCSECGTPLARACDTCGAQNAAGAKFCGECGASLTAATSPQPKPVPVPQAERRLVSVLFADLVGFTAASEGRDAEDTRELLSRYFETARQVIERYGGTIEKFIGDAVMAVWGAPVAQEDDADRAVRAALELVDAVTVLGTDLGAPDLRARVGVLTGEAAVTLGAEGQGMVAGDLVNTASRIQSVAQSGTVLVGAATKRASEGAIAYESAGIHELKGKSEPIELWRALRVVGLVGTTHSLAVEPPFVGRDRDLRLVKELFNGAAEDRRAQLVSVIGIGGIGKSRLAWEFEKYIDGLAENVLWHRGRCLSYGDGVAFWALAEMIRGRAGMLEDEPNETALPKLRAAVELHFEDSDERRFVERRLAHLLGLEGGASGDQENLFAAARMFFERVAARGPTVLVFEDIHWADSALLDFVEYLHDWSRDLPLFILTLARPELTERRPTWGAGKRNFTSITLEPLATDAMETLLTGPVPGLSDELRERILERAEGVPFYAVETVRMLLDRGLLVREDGSFQLTGEIDTLEVPETLQALIAARLDGLSPDERRLVQNAAVLGRTFTLRGLASVTGTAEDELEPILGSLMRKEVLSLQADPMSPERGQYGFIQDLVKKVAYDTLSKKERKSRHLAAAAYLRELGDDDEVVEVVASHYLDAYRSAPDDPDADAVKAEARTMLLRAGERGASLGATAEAQSRFEEAAALADDDIRLRAELYERAGIMARMGARVQQADEHFERAIALFQEIGAHHPAARVEARLAEVLWDTGRLETGVERMDRSFALLSQEEPDEDLAALAAQIGRFMFFAGELDTAADRIETALRIAEARLLPEVFAQALTTKAIMLAAHGRIQEGMALLRFALDTALEHDKPVAALRASYNLADNFSQIDRYEEAAVTVREGLVHARRVGNRQWEWSFLGQLYPLYALGEWDEALEMIGQLPEDRWTEARQAFSPVFPIGSMIHLYRGDLDEARRLATVYDILADSADVQERATYAGSMARIFLVEGDPAEATKAAAFPLELRETMGNRQEYVKEAWVTAVEGALDTGDLNRARDLLTILDELPPGNTSQFLQAHAARFRARVAASEGEKPEADRLYRRAAALFRDMSFPLYLGVTLLDQGEWLAHQGSEDQAAPLLGEAREIFERLRAQWWLDRVDALSRRVEVTA